MKPFISLVSALLFCSVPLMAQWTSSPEDNAQLTEIAGQERHTGLLSDGDGGWYVLYEHLMDNDEDLYLQRIDADGNILWTSTVADSDDARERNSAMVSDGAGGVIITWIDNRVANSTETYAQRFNAAGEAQWAVGGVEVSPVAGPDDPSESSVCPKIVAGDDGGAIITFVDDRVLANEQGIYAQYMNADGTRGALQFIGWLQNPAACSEAEYDICSDGNGGVYIVFEFASLAEMRNELRGMHLDAQGARMWPDEEVEFAPTIFFNVAMRIHASQHGLNNARMIPDANGGVYTIWKDNPGLFDPEVEKHTRGQRINAAGDLQWDAEGLMLNTLDETSPPVKAVSDSQGNLFFSYHDGDDYFLQKVEPSGMRPWNDGVVFRNQTAGIVPPLVVTSCDDVIVTHATSFDSDPHVYAARIGTDGDFVWEPSSKRVSSLMGDQTVPRIAIDADDKCALIWIDNRGFGSSSTEWNLYAQGISKDGQIGTITDVNNSPIGIGDLRVAPLPASQFVTIELPMLVGEQTLRVFNNNGQELLQQTLAAGQTQLELSVAGWTPGVYSLVVTNPANSGNSTRSAMYQARIVIDN